MWYHIKQKLYEIGWLVPEIQAVENFENNRKQRKFVLLLPGYISKSIFASSDSFCLITSHFKLKGALDNFSLIPKFFFKKVEIFISLEVYTYVVTAR